LKRFLTIAVALVAISVISAQLETLPEWAEGLKTQYPVLFHTFLRVNVWQWIGLGVLAFVGFLVGVVARWATLRLTRVRDHFAPAPMESSTRSAIGRSAGLVVGALFSILLLSDLDLNKAFQAHLENLLNSLALLGGVWCLYSWWDSACVTLALKSSGHERAERLLIPMMHKLIRATIIIGGLFAALAVFGGTKAIATLIGTLGIGGLVVALAAKDSIENLFGSFTILFDMPFALGDWVKIDKIEGTVEEINLRSTRLRTAEDTVIHLPNANLIRASVENFGSRRFRRIKMTLRLGYDTESAKVDPYASSLRDYLQAQPEVVPDHTEVVLTDPQEVSIGLLIDFRLEVGSYAQEIEFKHRLLTQALALRKVHEISLSPASTRAG